jgi:hypothetical protein
MMAPAESGSFVPRRRAWLSFTGLDLKAHADAVAHALASAGWACIRLEDLPASDLPPLALAKKEIESCELLIALVAHRYGGVPSPSEGGNGVRSWVWHEVEHALDARVGVRAFLLDDAASWPAQFVDRSPEDVARLADFKGFLREKVFYRLFKNREDLVAEVLRALPGPPPPPPPPPHRFVWEPVTDPLVLAWRLVVDVRAQPELLLHLEPTQLWAALDKLGEEVEATESSSGPIPVKRLLAHLETRQAGLEPNALWLEWMRHVHTSKVDAIKAGPTAVSVPPQAGTGGLGGEGNFPLP